MTELYAGTVGEFIENNDRRIVTHGDVEIGVFRRDGEFFAYRNHCAHQGGPACEGVTMAKVEDIYGPHRTVLGQRFSETDIHIVCPWHGVEYDLRTGVCVPNPRKRLQKFDVITKGNEIYVIV